MLTNETKDLINKTIDKLLDEVVETVHMGVAEDMSLNDIEFITTVESTLDEAQEYMIKTIEEGVDDEY